MAPSIRVLGTRGGSSILSTPIKLCIVGPARSKTRRCQRRDPSSNLGRCILTERRGRLAQSEERHASNVDVAGSSPAPPPNQSRGRNSNGKSASLPNSMLRVRVPPAASPPTLKHASPSGKGAGLQSRYRRFESDRVLSAHGLSSLRAGRAPSAAPHAARTSR